MAACHQGTVIVHPMHDYMQLKGVMANLFDMGPGLVAIVLW